MFATLISKWHLGPLRVINFLALLVLILRFGQQLKTVIQWRFLEILGAASLPVFCVHLIAALLALAAIGDNQGSTPLWVEAVLMAASFSAMYATARMSQRRRLGRTAFPAGDGTAVNARIAR
jgi:peptidoglycan/LPS O-acetylase OafA/YrhL